MFACSNYRNYVNRRQIMYDTLTDHRCSFEPIGMSLVSSALYHCLARTFDETPIVPYRQRTQPPTRVIGR
jgi:hypothetical protein